MLDKPEFDCNNLGSFYDCGCAEDENGEGGEGLSESKDGHSAATRVDAKGSGSDAYDHLAVEISKEQLVHSGIRLVDALVSY
jgi:FAD-linked sulfhydryl oxidase